jgi:hypothetical protein
MAGSRTTAFEATDRVLLPQVAKGGAPQGSAAPGPQGNEVSGPQAAEGSGRLRGQVVRQILN